MFLLFIQGAWGDGRVLCEDGRVASGAVVPGRWRLAVIPIIGVLVGGVLKLNSVAWGWLIVWRWRLLSVVCVHVGMVWRDLRVIERELDIIWGRRDMPMA